MITKIYVETMLRCYKHLTEYGKLYQRERERIAIASRTNYKSVEQINDEIYNVTKKCNVVSYVKLCIETAIVHLSDERIRFFNAIFLDSEKMYKDRRYFRMYHYIIDDMSAYMTAGGMSDEFYVLHIRDVEPFKTMLKTLKGDNEV